MADRRHRRLLGARTATVAAHLRLPQRCHVAGFEVRLRRRPPASAQRPQDAAGDAQQPAAGVGGSQFKPGTQLDQRRRRLLQRRGPSRQGRAHRCRPGRSRRRRRRR